jgi:subtilisin family serine protease
VAGGHYDPAPRAGEDVERHGTHVSGILAARPVEGSGDYRGIADGAEVVSVRVIDEQENADQGDVAEAIDLLSRGHEADLINLSLGGAAPSLIELDAILAALEAGTLCIAAAGNDFGQPLLFPAAYPQVMSISALGLLGAYPAGTSAAGTVPARADMFGPNGLYLANFNDVGPQLDGTAPGVGIVSTVPSWAEVATPYAAMSGTSTASPVACASLATLLSQDPIYRSTPRDATRAGRAAAVMKASLFPLGLDPVLAGSGMSRAWPW